MEGAIDQVLGVLGAAVPRDAVQRLLDDADGSVETALAMYFDGNDRSAVSTARQGEPLSKEEQLKAVLACDLTPAQLRGLLREAGGSVDAAVDLYFSRSQAPRSASPDVVVLDEAAGPSSAATRPSASGSNRAALGLPPRPHSHHDARAGGRSRGPGARQAARRSLPRSNPPAARHTLPRSNPPPTFAEGASGSRRGGSRAGSSDRAGSAAPSNRSSPTAGSDDTDAAEEVPNQTVDAMTGLVHSPLQPGTATGRRQAVGRRSMHVNRVNQDYVYLDDSSSGSSSSEDDEAGISGSDSGEQQAEDRDMDMFDGDEEGEAARAHSMMVSAAGGRQQARPAARAGSATNGAARARKARTKAAKAADGELTDVDEHGRLHSHALFTAKQRQGPLPEGVAAAAKLPLPQLRRQGQLHCRDAAKVPAAGVDDSNPWASAAFPLQLGSVRVPLPKQQQEADFIKVIRMVESGELSSDALVFGTHHTVAAWHIVRVMSVGVARWAVNNSEPLLGPVPKADVVTQLKHILKDLACQPSSGSGPAYYPLATSATRDGTWYELLADAVGFLEQAGLIEVKWTLEGPTGPVTGPAGKGKGKGKSTAAPADPSKRPRKRAKHAPAEPVPSAAQDGYSLLLEISLLRKAFEKCGVEEQDAALDCTIIKSKRRAPSATNRHNLSLGSLLHCLLLHGEGLWVGPDSDGLLNICDDEQLREVCGSADAKGAGPSSSAAPPPAKQAAPVAPPAAFGLDSLLRAAQLPPSYLAAAIPEGVQSVPKLFQLQGLNWMLRREREGEALGRSLLQLHSAWVQLVTRDGFIFYVHRFPPHVITTHFFPAPVGGTCGGFLCDEMGLGKSLQSLMLVLTNPAPKGWVNEPSDHDADGTEPCPIGTTLLVVPANLMPQWRDEIETHVAPGSLRICTYEGTMSQPTAADPNAAAGPSTSGAVSGDDDENDGRPARLRRTTRRTAPHIKAASAHQRLGPLWGRDADGQAVAVHACDVCLMSYELLRNELGHGASSPLLRFGFWRIMLDEAQLVANTSSVAAVMASSLWRRHAWVVTGTPVSSRLSEIQGLCEFLALEPVYHTNHWRTLLQCPHSMRSTAGVLAFRQLLQGVMLRRTKAAVAGQLALPPCTRQDIMVKLSTAERAMYSQVLRKFNHLWGQLAAQMSARRAQAATQGNNPSEPSGRHNRIMGGLTSALTALRQCCCHPQIMRSRMQGALMSDAKRLSMRQIMGQLVARAFGEFDQAAAAWMGIRVLQAGWTDWDQELLGDALLSLLQEVRQQTAVASVLDIRAQALCRKSDGTLDLRDAPLEAVAAVAAAAGSLGSPATVCAQANGGLGTTVVGAGAGALLRQGSGGGDGDSATGPDAAVAPGGAGPASTSHAWPRSRAAGAGAQSRGVTAAGVAAAAGSAAAGTAVAGSNAHAGGSNAQAGGCSSRAAVGGGHARAAISTGAARAGVDGSGEAASSGPAPMDLDGPAAAGADAAGNAVGPSGDMAKGTHANGVDKQQQLQQQQQGAQQGASVQGEAQAAGLAQGDQEGAGGQGEASVLSPEEKVAKDAQQERARRWLRIELDALQLLSYTLNRLGGQGQGQLLGGCSTTATAAAAPSAAPAGPSVGSKRSRPSRAGKGRDGRSGREASAKGKEAAESGPPALDGPAQEAMCALRQDVSVQMSDLRLRLGLEALPGAALMQRGGLRKSRRQQGLAAPGSDEEEGGEGSEPIDVAAAAAVAAEAAEAVLAAEVVIREFRALTRKKDPEASLRNQLKSAAERMAAARRNLEHMLNKEAEMLQSGQADAPALDADAADAAGTNADGAGTSTAAGKAAAAPGAAGEAQLTYGQQQLAHPSLANIDPNTCPICLDVFERRTVTSCGHTFCTDCIHECVLSGGAGGVPCPICRAPLTSKELYDSVTDAEARDMAAADAASGEYGAKVSALLSELAAMEPGSKAVVFSAWGRLLGLVGEALKSNGVAFARFAGADPERRQVELQRFLHDPDCRVLLLVMSTSGGAAGLTLTAATTAFIMEPPLNPGLEAQAAARIHRLGQTRPTRVVRFIAEDTVEANVLALQEHKAAQGAQPATAAADECDSGQMLTFFNLSGDQRAAAQAAQDQQEAT